MELRPERQHDLLGAVPRRDERRALVTEVRQRRAQHVRVAGRLDDERHLGLCTALGQHVLQIFGCGAAQPEAGHHLSSPPARLDGDDAGSGSLHQQAREGANGSEAVHHDALTEHRAGVQADLQGRLHEWEHRRGAIIHGTERHDVGLTGDEQLLVGVEGEDPGPDRDVTSALLHHAHAAVAVAEREAEGAAERADRLVDREVGIELATVGEHLRAGTDPRERRAHEDVPVVQGGKRSRAQLHTTRFDEPETARVSRSSAISRAFPDHLARVSGRR